MAYKKYFALLYDLFYQEKPYKKEADFIINIIKVHFSDKNLNVLELACGTGNHAQYYADQDWQISLTDGSDDMISLTRKKFKNHKNVSVSKMDMLEFNSFDKPFDVILCLFDSIGYLVTNENIQTLLTQISQNLKKDGVFIFEYWNAGAFLRNFESCRVKRIELDQKEIIRISETEIDYPNQLGIVHYTIMEVNDNQIEKYKETHKNRFFLLKEIEVLLNNAELESTENFGGYSRDDEINMDSWHTLCIAKKY